jgi:N-hydroxyarylamine O-acetyltransferase
MEYRLDHTGQQWALWRREVDGEWDAQYGFTLQPRRLQDFAAMCHYQQTSPDSYFTHGRLCTLIRPGGHVTLSDHRLIVVEDGRRVERPIDGPAGFATALLEHFGLDAVG